MKLLGRTNLSPSRIYKALEPLSYEVTLAIMANTKSKIAKKYIMDFFKIYHHVRLKIKGQDLKDMGLKPGPKYKKILDKVLSAKVDGKIKTKRDEVRMVKKLI